MLTRMRERIESRKENKTGNSEMAVNENEKKSKVDLRFKAAEKHREIEIKCLQFHEMKNKKKGSEMSGKQQSRFSFVFQSLA